MGDSGVGKTSLINVYSKGSMQDNVMPTIGLEFTTDTFTLKDGSQIKIQLYDTAGQEKYRSIVANYCRKALGCLLVYDITKRNTFEQCKLFVDEVRSIAEPDCVILLVGNKTDLEDKREVSKDEGKKFSSENKMYFMETSAKSGEKVNEAFHHLFERKLISFVYYYFYYLFVMFYSCV
jgi:small GTP-binding protein